MTPNNIIKPRALYLTFNVGFMGPTRELLLEVLQNSTELTIFGPGYSSEDEVLAGVEAFVEKNGPYDVILTDEYVLQNFDMEHPERNRFVNHACRFDRGLLFQAAHWRDFLKSYDGIRVICLLQSDYYNFTPLHTERLLETGDYYIGWGEELILEKSMLPFSKVPPECMEATTYKKWRDDYHDFVKANRNRVISTPMFISKDECCDRPLEKRPYDWTCLGADYNARVIARKKLDEAGFKRPGRWMPRAFSVAGKLNFNMYNKYWTLAAIRWGFRRALRQSKYTFTCGSLLKWPIRKFFEVPANGSVLVCEPFKGFEALGYANETNALTVEADDILEAHAWLNTNPDRAQAIATAGRELVLQSHSVEARSEQIALALQAILARQFSGSRWVDGKFTLYDY